MAAEFNITVRAGRDFYLPVKLITALGNPANLTNYQLEMTVKKLQSDPDSSALYKGGPGWINLAFGHFTFHITPAENSGWWEVSTPGSPGAPISNTIVYDVSCLDIANPPNFVTLLEGTVGILGPVTGSIP